MKLSIGFSFSQSQRSRAADLELLLSVVRFNQLLHFSRSVDPINRVATQFQGASEINRSNGTTDVQQFRGDFIDLLLLQYYNTWLSLFGLIICVAIMFLIDWVTSLVTFVIIFALYLIVVYRKPDVNWGSSTQAQTYKSALSVVYKYSVERYYFAVD